MKTPKEQAEELVEQFFKSLIDGGNLFSIESDAVKCAIKSVEHTIEVLEKIQDKNAKDDIDNYHITMEILEQTEILTELKAKL